MSVCLFDPGIENEQGTPSSNLGNAIIQAAVHRELRQLFPDEEIVRISTFQTLSRRAIGELWRCAWVIVGGTNILTSHMDDYRQWVISLRHAIHVRRAILMGVGWWRYQEPPNLFTLFFLACLLARRAVHSVRDGYTQQMLRRIGYRKVLNTGCPTMWPLAGARPDEFPASKAEDALLMLTDYAADPACDRKLIDILVRKYRRVFFWPQGKYDLRDIQALGAPVTILDRSFAALNEFLATGPPVDYVGTRLHGGIHCLNHRKRSLILEVDNRAREISRDTGLLVVPRDDFGAIERWIDHGRSFHLHLNEAAIAEWKAQFIAPKRHKKSSEPGPNP